MFAKMVSPVLGKTAQMQTTTRNGALCARRSKVQAISQKSGKHEKNMCVAWTAVAKFVVGGHVQMASARSICREIGLARTSKQKANKQNLDINFVILVSQAEQGNISAVNALCLMKNNVEGLVVL